MVRYVNKGVLLHPVLSLYASSQTVKPDCVPSQVSLAAPTPVGSDRWTTAVELYDRCERCDKNEQASPDPLGTNYHVGVGAQWSCVTIIR